MLAGDTGASNIDPYAEKRTNDNQWIAEGPHIMVLLPDLCVPKIRFCSNGDEGRRGQAVK